MPVTVGPPTMISAYAANAAANIRCCSSAVVQLLMRADERGIRTRHRFDSFWFDSLRLEGSIANDFVELLLDMSSASASLHLWTLRSLKAW